MGTDSKIQQLRRILLQMRSVLVAFSGGVDSTFLLAVAAETLGKNVLAVTGVSASVPQAEVHKAASLGKELDVRHRLVRAAAPEGFWKNSPQRCYYCKKALFVKLKQLAEKEKMRYVIDASNADDSADFRPGTNALKELGIRSPLKEAGLTKQEIRFLSRRLGLDGWDKPAQACLASRIPYGDRITPEKLLVVAQAEEFICKLGFKQVRVRLHGRLARIEVNASEIPAVVRVRKKIAKKLKSFGLTYVSLDLEGYRAGSLNEVLGWKRKK